MIVEVFDQLRIYVNLHNFYITGVINMLLLLSSRFKKYEISLTFAVGLNHNQSLLRTNCPANENFISVVSLWV